MFAEVGSPAPVAAIGRDRSRKDLRRLAVVDTGRATLPAPRQGA